MLPLEQHCVVQHTHLQELARTCFLDDTLALHMDEVKITDHLVFLVISTCINDKALPLAWHAEQTGGHIPFETQAKLLNDVVDLLPRNVPVILRADYFYGTKSLVAWCQKHQFSYRIRIKGNLLFQHEDATLDLLHNPVFQLPIIDSGN